MPRTWLAVVALALATLIAIGYAFAHPAPSGWHYSPECCHDRDCSPAPDGEVVPVPGGWRIVPTAEMIPHGKTRPSPDGLIHRCIRTPPDRASPTLCLYVPPFGS